MIEDKFYIINLDDDEGPGTHWVAVYNVGDDCLYFDSFGLEPAEELKKFMKSSGKRCICNIYRIQALESIMCGYFCIDIINAMQRGDFYGDWLLQYSPSKFEENDKRVKKNIGL